MQHVIRKQLFEISSARRDVLFSLQHEASDYYYKQVLPLLEEIFDELSIEDEVLQLDRLEIDLGLIALDKTSGKINCKDLGDLLRRQISEIAGSKTTAGQRHKESRPPGVKRIRLAQNACEQWIYYMRHGLLPWNLAVITDEWKTQALEILATEFSMVTAVRGMIRQKESITRRIVLSHEESFLVKLMEILTAHEQKALPGMVSELVQLYQLTGKNTPAQNPAAVWIQLLQQGSINESAKSPQQVVQILVDDHFDTIPAVVDQLSAIKQTLPLLEPLIRKASQKQFGKENDSTGKKEGKENIAPPAMDGDKDADKIIKTADEITKEAFAPAPVQLPEEGLFVEHAGLVLLHPFFRHLFKNTNLLLEGKFAGRNAQEKAILLLHYAVSGNAGYEEYQLAVPKILCSWPMEEPLSIHAALAPHEIIEADDMLRAVLAQWSKLKNTSPAGLREGFLQRRGKTFLHNGSIYFQVEKSAIDVLLDLLPWNLSLIKLPWLNELIRVEWR